MGSVSNGRSALTFTSGGPLSKVSFQKGLNLERKKRKRKESNAEEEENTAYSFPPFSNFSPPPPLIHFFISHIFVPPSYCTPNEAEKKGTGFKRGPMFYTLLIFPSLCVPPENKLFHIPFRLLWGFSFHPLLLFFLLFLLRGWWQLFWG